MCGIFGCVKFKDHDFPEKESHIFLRHRGPDESHTFENKNIFFAHHRLSIIDLKSGQQPMCTKDRRFWCVYNGEIYNYKTLKEELREKGHLFSTTSDTEVLIHLYEEYGSDCLEKINGMFAFAIWDDHKKRLFCARDRLGIKPLYYARTPYAFFFASEIKALSLMDNISTDIHTHSFFEFLSYRYISGPDTIYCGIHELEPAHSMTISGQHVHRHHYWSPVNSPEKDGISPDQKADSLLNESIKRRLVSDVPFGVFLSGGLDSSLILSYMSEHLGSNVQAFNIRFEDDAFDESAYARISAEHFGADLHSFTFTSKDMMRTVIPALSHFDQPFADEAAIPTYLLSRETKKHVKMVLTGEGGDELFLGYSRYLALKNNLMLSRALSCLPGKILDLADNLIHSPYSGLRITGKAVKNIGLSPHQMFYTWISPNISLEDLLHPRLRQEFSGFSFLASLEKYFLSADPVSDARHHDLFRYLPCNLLKKIDMTSMAFGLEARVPFLDHNLVQYLLQIPAGSQMGFFSGKKLLKKIARKRLPSAINRRKKHGFSVPVSYWFRHGLRDLLVDTISSSQALSKDFFDQTYLKKILKFHLSGEKDYSRALWMVFCFEIWHQKKIKNQK